MFTDELFAAYLEGNVTAEEAMKVILAMRNDKSLREAYFIVNSIEFNEESSGRRLPMERLAAAAENNLCDILCEKRILRDYCLPDDVVSLLSKASENKWIKEKGIPLYNMGRLLEKSGMSVIRKYDCSLEELKREIDRHNKVMAVLDYSLLKHESVGEMFHAVCCISYIDNLIKIYDPAVDRDVELFSDDFCRSWSVSRNYMVVASAGGNLEYEPHPVLLDDVILDDDLLELMEAIAENVHETWAGERHKEGWRFGEKRDDAKMTTPDMVPYSDLDDSEKEFDRKTAYNTLRLVKKLGFSVSRRSTHLCSECGCAIESSMHFCPNCGRLLQIDDRI